MTMRRKQTSAKPTEHAMLVIWGEFAQSIGLVKRMMAIQTHQKERTHSAQRKILESMVATLAGLPHLQDISRSAHPLDQDRVVAEAWGQSEWADYSGVSRTLQALSLEEAQQVMSCLQQASQPFIDAEVNLALAQEGRLVYDGDLTGLPVSKASTTYPQVAYGHMDDSIRLGYQAAVISMRSPSYKRIWLAVEHHPGNALSSDQAAALLTAAEAITGRRPWRRVDLLEQRLPTIQAECERRQKRQADLQRRLGEAQARWEQVQQEISDFQVELTRLEQVYQSQQRIERPTSAVAKLRKRLQVHQNQAIHRQAELEKVNRLCGWAVEWVGEYQTKLQELQNRLERFRQENATNPQPIQAVYRIDAGFGTWDNVAMLMEMGYEVFTKANNAMSVETIFEAFAAEDAWQTVAVTAQMQTLTMVQPEKFCYPVDLGLERLVVGPEKWKHSLLIHFGPQPVASDGQAWFDFYNGRQTIEAGIKENKRVFFLHRIKVRSIPAIVLQEAFVVFAANFIRWANAWLAQHASGSALPALDHHKTGTKRLVHVLAHTSAVVSRDANICLVRFSPLSCLAGKELRLPCHTSPPRSRWQNLIFFQSIQRFSEWLHNS
jgi:hypothetical protein